MARLHQWVKPRSLLLHLVFVAVAGGCLYAGWWQVHRAMAGNFLSYLYSVEWPAFAVVAGIGWWQMVHDTPEDIEARRAYRVRMREASKAVVARTLPRSALAVTASSEELGRSLPSGAVGAISAPSAVADEGLRAALVPLASTLERSVGESIEASEEGGRMLEPEEDLDPDDELAAYNRYLALLAVKGGPKTWRNPRGL